MAESALQEDVGLAFGLVERKVPALDIARITEAAVGAVVDAVAGKVERRVKQHPPARRRPRVPRRGFAKPLDGQRSRPFDKRRQRPRRVQVLPGLGDLGAGQPVVVDKLAGPSGRAVSAPCEFIGHQVEAVEPAAIFRSQPAVLLVKPLIAPALESIGQFVPLKLRRGLLPIKNAKRVGKQRESGGGVNVGPANPLRKGSDRESGACGHRTGRDQRSRESRNIASGQLLDSS
jgi:hypothetical protein